MPAILNQQTVLNTNVSLSSFFFPFFLLYFLSFFFLFFSLYFSFFYLRKYLSPLVHLRLKKRIFSVYFFPFLNIYIQVPIFRKGRRKNSFKLYLSFRRIYFSDSFLLRASGISVESGGRRLLLSSVQRSCSTLSSEFG